MSTCDSEKRGGAAKFRMLDKANQTTAWLSILTVGQLVYLKAGDKQLAANPALNSLKGVRLAMPPMCDDNDWRSRTTTATESPGYHPHDLPPHASVLPAASSNALASASIWGKAG